MKSWSGRFNTYLIALGALALTACETTRSAGQPAKDVATLRLHLESREDGLGRNLQVMFRNPKPELITVAADPILSEANLQRAELWDGEQGQFAIRLQFDRRGQQLLDMTSMSYRGKRLAVMVQAPHARCLAAPRLDRRIDDGVVIFVTDATREEAERIVRALNNTVAKLAKSKS